MYPNISANYPPTAGPNLQVLKFTRIICIQIIASQKFYLAYKKNPPTLIIFFHPKATGLPTVPPAKPGILQKRDDDDDFEFV